jgi:PAT family beta-lactamase induction signal transducer AmpG
MSWAEALHLYTRPRVITMLFLGFSSGLPFLLVFSTLSAWLTDANVDRATIGFFSWIGITYSIKFFWAPVIDRLPVPVFTRVLGRRRSWMLIGQIGIGLGLLGMASTDPHTDLLHIALFGLLVAFSSATQDISIDAFRIEAVVKEWQGAMAATYILGYRLALLVAGAGALYIADFSNWVTAYLVMAACVSVGVLTVIFIREPDVTMNGRTHMQEQRVIDYLERNAHLPHQQRMFMAWFIGAVICPFTDFFKRNGVWMALLILLFVGVYRISDITMGVMANPFYLDHGYSKTEIASIGKVFGFFMTIFGSALGGLFVARYGIMKPLLAGAVMVAATNLLFAYLATIGADIEWLAIVISADNLSGGFAVSAFVAYLSSLTNTAYTATQYALFSSLMTLPAKVIGGFSGIVVVDYGYEWFFVYASMLGLPAILLVMLLMHRMNADKLNS